MPKKDKVPVDPVLLARARAMRREPASAEKKLWSLLRRRQLNGLEFRRQAPVGAFVADFLCHDIKLIVELDGDTHATRSQEDEARTRILQREGYHVVRFWNTDVFENLEGVLQCILETAEQLRGGKPPHPSSLPEREGTRQAVTLLRQGRLVAFPTETVYGLGADARDAEAVRRIYDAKGRPATNPVIVHVASPTVAQRYTRAWSDRAQRLADAFWPGPLTLVLPKTDEIPDIVSAGRATVGLRAPDHPLALELLAAFDGPIAAPSANRSNHVSPTTAQHVRDELGDHVDLILDGGPCAVGIESTVLDLSGETPTVLRPGAITQPMLQAILRMPVAAPHGAISPETMPSASPGQQRVHYAPRTPAYHFLPHERDRIDLTDAALLPITLDADAYARQLYARLRLLDQQSLRAIYIELPPDVPEWHAVRDRILRATRPLPPGPSNS